MTTERAIPESVYQELPDGRPIEELYAQVVSATGTRQVHVSGTVALDTEGNVVGAGQMGTQVETALDNIRKSLEHADASVSDVVRIKIYTVDVEEYVAVGTPELVSFFGEDSLPASTLLGVDALAHPDLLVEIEATAVVE
jgi:enamine deaminase RidA (YjgF/YER057c/UK114 family)